MIATAATVPTVDIQSVSGLSASSSLIYDALTHYPYFAVVNGLPPMEDAGQLSNLVCAIRAKLSPPTDTNREPLTEVSFTKVFIKPDSDPLTQDKAQKEAEESGVTQYSRTHLPLSPHTDSSYALLPHEIVVFHCVRSDDDGGETIMVPVDDILKRLDEDVIARLRKPVYPFGEGLHPILTGREAVPLIRYYRAQVERTMAQSAITLAPEYVSALDALDVLLARDELFFKFHLRPGQTLFMHNQRVMHARTALSPTTDRLLYRLRMHAYSLSADEGIAPARDSEAHLDLAIALEDLGRLARARYHYRKACELSSNDTEALEMFGAFLLESGEFDRAAEIFRQCLMIEPEHYEAGLALSSMARMAGREEDAMAYLEQVMPSHPLIMEDEYIPDLPTVLRMRGIEGAAYSIMGRPDGRYTSLLRGGHFAITHLMDVEDYNLLLLNIFDNNVDSIEAMPPFDLMLNTIACPDSKPRSLQAAVRFVERFPQVPVINHPRRVLETTREQNSLRLNEIDGVVFPKTEKILWLGAPLEATVQKIFERGFTFPFILRKVGSQTGQSVALVRDEKALRAYLLASPIEQAYYVIQFHDCCVREDVYHKMRIFFIDGVLYPVANVFHDRWNIHSGDRYSVMDKSAWMQAEEQTFLNTTADYLGEENIARLYRIRDLVQLDFFGIDFTVLSDNRLFIFELNAAMRHNFDHAKNFPYTEPHLRRVSDAFAAMVKARLA